MLTGHSRMIDTEPGIRTLQPRIRLLHSRIMNSEPRIRTFHSRMIIAEPRIKTLHPRMMNAQPCIEPEQTQTWKHH
jgi:hypothetical protein